MIVRTEFVIVLVALTAILTFTYLEPAPVRKMLEWRAAKNAKATTQISPAVYEIYDHTPGDEPDVTIDIVKGKHFWHPQLAIWIEDSAGHYVESLLVTMSTARGLFYSGRSASNFRESDGAKTEEDASTRRVDALPYWSHKRNHKYVDGFYSPPPGEPLPDGITGATPRENFYFKKAVSRIDQMKSFRIMVEINVAFDENEFYSEFDFLEDSLYHGGTGLLGQPSLVYGATINNTDDQRYYILPLLGHGHHSGATGELIADLSSITTAKYIVERIVVGVREGWYVGL